MHLFDAANLKFALLKHLASIETKTFSAVTTFYPSLLPAICAEEILQPIKLLPDFAMLRTHNVSKASIKPH